MKYVRLHSQGRGRWRHSVSPKRFWPYTRLQSMIGYPLENCNSHIYSSFRRIFKIHVNKIILSRPKSPERSHGADINRFNTGEYGTGCNASVISGRFTGLNLGWAFHDFLPSLRTNSGMVLEVPQSFQVPWRQAPIYTIRRCTMSATGTASLNNPRDTWGPTNTKQERWKLQSNVQCEHDSDSWKRRKWIFSRRSLQIEILQKGCYYSFFAKLLEIFHVPPEEFRNHRNRTVISNFTERKIVKVDDALHYRLWQKIPVGPVPAAAPSSDQQRSAADQQWLATGPDKDERAVRPLSDFHALVRESFGEKFSRRGEKLQCTEEKNCTKNSVIGM
jgi:hypothetical protein